MSNALVFQDTVLDVIDRDGQQWIQSRQLAAALGYKDESSVSRIYERNKDEFSPMMTATVKLTVGITPVEVRIFSLRGCHLLAMFARTHVAKAFRVWVLDVLDRMPQHEPRALPKAKPKPKPVSAPPLAPEDKTGAAMKRFRELCKEFYAVGGELENSLRAPYRHCMNTPPAGHHRNFGFNMNYGVQALFLAVCKNMEALDFYYQAHIEGEKMMRG